MDVLLLNPPPNDRSWYRVEHLGIAYLAAVLRQAGHTVHLLDSLLEDLDIEQTHRAIEARFGRLDVVGITATEPETIKSGVAVVRRLRRNGLDAHVTSGGYLPTFWSDELLREYPEVDSVVVGEGEDTLRHLVQTVQDGGDLGGVPGLVFRGEGGAIVHNTPRRLIEDLDQLPFPARDYLPTAYQKYHHALVYGSRGCYHQCSFCQISQFYRLSPGGPYRTRSASNIAAEIEDLVNGHGVRSIFFADDEFITESSRRRRIIEDLIQEIRERELEFSFSIQYRADTGAEESLLRALKEVGLRTVFIGVESGVERVLERFDKGISKADIDQALRVVGDLDLSLIPGYMLYNPDTTFEELRDSVEYLLSPGSPMIQDLHGMNLLRGTAEERDLHRRGMVEERGVRIGYRILDGRVAAFVGWLRGYYQLYRPAILDVYELLFMLVELPEEILRDMRFIENRIRRLHEEFLSRAIDGLSQGRLDEEPPMDDLKVAYELLNNETQRLVAAGREAARVATLLHGKARESETPDAAS